MITPMAPPADKAGAAGFSISLLQGAIPGAAARDATLRATGTGPVGSRSFERFKYFGQMLGSLALTAFGMGGSAGGIALNATGIGAAIGVPAVAVSYTVAMAGIANTVAGFEGMLQSLATGGSAGPLGVSAGPAAPVKPQGQVHHAISKRIWKALEKNPGTKGHYKHRDSRFESRAATSEDHRGYWGWHEELDNEIVEWINSQDKLTPEAFEKYLQGRYSQPDLSLRFPNGLKPNVE